MRIHIPPSYPPETLVLFVLSTWHVLIALLISRVGVLRREAILATSVQVDNSANNAFPSVSQGAAT